MMVVVGILGVMAAIAVPDLTPAIQRAKFRSQLVEVSSFVERARREARASGRCVRIRQTSPGNFAMQKLLDADCFTGSRTQSGSSRWSATNITQLAQRPGFTITMGLLPTGGCTGQGCVGDANPEIVYRPSGRLRGDGDINVADDGARFVVTSPSLPGQFGLVQLTPIGRVCGTIGGGVVPALTAPIDCGLGVSPPPAPGPGPAY
jgi:Tfp pilus assembly protein FimT